MDSAAASRQVDNATSKRAPFAEVLSLPYPSLPAASCKLQAMHSSQPVVGIIIGSQTDWPHLQPACDLLTELGVPYEARVVSAHRTPDLMFEYAAGAEGRGLHCIIAAAGGAAHLPGMVASKTLVPVLGVPVPSTTLQGLDSLLSIVQMPGGVPVGTLAVGRAGATNAAILAAEIVGLSHPEVRERLRAWREARRDAVLGQTLPPAAGA